MSGENRSNFPGMVDISPTLGWLNPDPTQPVNQGFNNRKHKSKADAKAKRKQACVSKRKNRK